MTVYEICEKIIESLQENLNIKKYSTDNFESESTFWLGVDDENPPAKTLMPIIAVSPVSTGISNDYNHNSHMISIAASIEDSELSQSNNMYKFTGYQKINQLLSLIQIEVTNNVLSSISQDEIALTNISEIRINKYFPYFNGQFDITIATEV